MRVVTAAAVPARVHALVRCSTEGLPRPLAAALELRLANQPVVALPSLGQASAPLVVVAKPPDWNSPLEVRRRAGAIGRALAAERITSVACELPAAAQALIEPFLVGLVQGSYAWDRYQPQAAPRLAELVLVGSTASRQALDAALRLAQAVTSCRDLINMPAADCGPDEMEAAARDLARRLRIRIRVHDERALEKLGMGCLLAVGRASPRRPRLIELQLPGPRGAKPLALCGKGVCFDTGGLNLKAGDGMTLMRKDMGGAATVLAALAELGQRGTSRPVTAWLPLVDNAIAGDAYRPGDVLTACDGTTIEVANTDAEGRLILADAIAHARRQGAAGIVSVATLTGAALTALGRIHVPLMATDDALAESVLAAARSSGEKLWRLPLDAEHRALVKGQVAQLTNSGGPDAACITAGSFLAHFAGNIPFAHLDISPTSWAVKPHELGPAGATGTLVTTLVSLCS